nr:MAG TPA: hypothetical protein [Caudoviricetes sp.]
MTGCKSCAYTGVDHRVPFVVGNGTETPGLQELGVFCIICLPLFSR